MQWSFILSRMWRGRREMIMLLVAISLVTGFFALSPLYLRVLGESALLYTIENAPPRDLTLSMLSETRFGDDTQDIVREELGRIAAGSERRARMNGVVCNSDPRFCLGDEFSRAYVPGSYERLEDRFAVVEGEFPRVDTDAAITVQIAVTTGLSAGDTITYYPGLANEVTVNVVGILEPVQPDDPFWLTQGYVLEGQLIDVTENFQRFDFGVIMTESGYEAIVQPIAPTGTQYERFVAIDASAMRASNLPAIMESIDSVERRVRLIHPDLTVASGLITLFTRFQLDLSTAEGTVILFAGGILLLMMYQLMTTTALILERQAVEWSSMISRGASTWQLTWMQVGTLSILALLAFALGLPIAALILLMISRFSPLSPVLGSGLTISGVPPSSIALSAVAALLAVTVLTIPAIPAARAGLLRLKQSVSRPPISPVWSRFYLDIVLLGLSAILALRLFALFGGSGLDTLLSDPTSLLTMISSRAAQESGLLSDPFNLMLPLLLITGIALLWLRLFPWLMRALSRVLNGSNGLMAPLALWNIARDPGHYAQLVMMLIGTLAIGTASLALAATHDAGAWTEARKINGADVALTFEAQAPDSETLAGSSERLARYTFTDRATQQQITVLGLERDAFAALTGDNPPQTQRSGIVLPTDAAEISVQLYAEPLESGEPIQTRISLDVVNAIGVPQSIPFTTADDTITQSFMEYRAQLPDNPHLPFTLIGVRFLSRAAALAFQHVVYLDDVTLTTAEGEVTVLDDFERASLNEWALQALTPVPVTPTRSASVSGIYALRAQYSIAQRGGLIAEPVLAARVTVADAAVPVILSDGLATALMNRTQRRAFSVGETATLPIPLPTGDRELRFRVYGQLAEFPGAGDRWLIAPLDDLLFFLNTSASPESYYAANTVWLDVPDRQLSAEARRDIDALPGLISVDEAWTDYNLLLREPLPNAIIGVLFAGFWISLLLGLLDFGFYLAMTSARRATTFAVLRAFGLNGSRLWALLTAEQVTLIAPAIAVGVLLGVVLAYLLIPFLILFSGAGLLIPAGQISVLLIIFTLSFGLLLTAAAWLLNRSAIGQVLRMGDK